MPSDGTGNSGGIGGSGSSSSGGNGGSSSSGGNGGSNSRGGGHHGRKGDGGASKRGNRSAESGGGSFGPQSGLGKGLRSFTDFLGLPDAIRSRAADFGDFFTDKADLIGLGLASINPVAGAIVGGIPTVANALHGAIDNDFSIADSFQSYRDNPDSYAALAGLLSGNPVVSAIARNAPKAANAFSNPNIDSKDDLGLMGAVNPINQVDSQPIAFNAPQRAKSQPQQSGGGDWRIIAQTDTLGALDALQTLSP